MRTLDRSGWSAAFPFLAVALFGFTVFQLIPIIRGFYYSVTDWNLLQDPTFVGLKNFQDIIDDKVFWNALIVTTEYVLINIGLQTVLAIGIALVMDRLTRSTLLRSLILVPWLISNVVVAMTFLWILDFNLGIVNKLITSLGLGGVSFFGEQALVMPTIAVINVWRHMGYTALLIFGGLQLIPKEMYEAGGLDGASEWQMFRKITLPLLRPVLALVLTITIIGSFQIFDTVAVATQGGPVNASRVINYYIFDQAFGRFHFGYAAAMAVVLFAILAAISFIQLRLSRAGTSDLA
jgi:multiple sugar transport system permease protein